ncbi:hypothetical protein SEA_ABBYDAISY_58 [Arthrobacter phage AbbyDaisy]|nr:hypothetical protein SEA_ABBYDAISY_58 [Arthrobacter phage AbbyDaisy]
MTSKPIYCPRQTHPQTRDTPAEFCENEVDNEGDLCSDHEEDDRSDELYDQYLDAKFEENQLGPWGDD